MSEILIIKLISGEEVIAKVDESAGAFALGKPMAILQYPDEATGQMRMGFVPYSHLCEEDSVIILKNGVLSIGQPVAQIKQQYQNVIGDIIVPDNKIILS